MDEVVATIYGRPYTQREIDAVYEYARARRRENDAEDILEAACDSEDLAPNEEFQAWAKNNHDKLIKEIVANLENEEFWEAIADDPRTMGYANMLKEMFDEWKERDPQ